MAKTKPMEVKEDEKWRIEADARLIRDYAELISDKTRYEKAKNFLKEQQNALTKILKQEGN